MFVNSKVFIAIIALAVVTEEVAGHKLLLGAAHITKKVILAKMHLMKPIVRGIAAKKIIAAKIIGAKALIGAKVGLGAMAIRHVTGGITAGVGKKQTVARQAPITPMPAMRSAINFPEINVPVRFSVGAPQPAIRSQGKTREATKL